MNSDGRRRKPTKQQPQTDEPVKQEFDEVTEIKIRIEPQEPEK